MNERIKELVARADMYANEQNELYGVSYSQTFNEKFGELLIRKCAIIADTAQAEDMGWDIGGIIKEHFGVEE